METTRLTKRGLEGMRVATSALLAGAYPGAKYGAHKERVQHTHAFQLDEAGREVRALCGRVSPGSSAHDQTGSDRAPTCLTCLMRWRHTPAGKAGA